MPEHHESIELPPYRAVLVCDTKGFGGNSDPDQVLLAEAIPSVLSGAFERIGLPEVWWGALFPHNTGDGYGIGFDTRHLPAVVSGLFDALQDVLAETGTGLRMRASLNVGPVREPGAGDQAAVVGSTVITTHRLLDAAPVREVLTRSDPSQTFLSVALSQRVFDDVVASGYSALSPSRLVARTVEIKEFAGVVYLYVPRLSGLLLEDGIGEEQAAAGDSHQNLPPQAPPLTNVIGMNVGSSIQVGQVKGGMHHQS